MSKPEPRCEECGVLARYVVLIETPTGYQCVPCSSPKLETWIRNVTEAAAHAH